MRGGLFLKNGLSENARIACHNDAYIQYLLAAPLFKISQIEPEIA